jgi:cellulose synthase/poly-beta-1,6-N-acetylglucosamine synthase-like glycosyltransferase
MTFIVDNILYIFSCFFWVGKAENFAEYRENIKVDESLVTVLIPAKNELYQTMKQTIESINSQTIVPQIYIILDRDDLTTVKYAKVLEKEFKNVKALVYRNNSKAEALNLAMNFVTSKYVLIIDVGDVFENRDAVEILLRVAESGNYDAVVSRAKAQFNHLWWQKFVDAEMMNWISNVLRRIKKIFGFIPLPGTGLLIKSDALRKNPFPETLAEDASLGLKIRNVGIAKKSILLYNLPRKLRDHLKQRARWIAGFIQTIFLAKGKDKLVYAMPIVQGLVPISLICLPVVMFLGLYSSPWTIVDWLAGMVLMWYILRLFRQTKNALILLIPIWWIVAGISFYLAIYYAVKKKWYFSPKEVMN